MFSKVSVLNIANMQIKRNFIKDVLCDSVIDLKKLLLGQIRYSFKMNSEAVNERSGLINLSSARRMRVLKDCASDIEGT